MTVRSGRRMVIPAFMEMRSRGPASAAPVIPWYRAGGAPAPLAAYQPKGAASLAASYTNLANPGTYDAAPGVAPTFNAATGWTFDGLTQYLNTGIDYTSPANRSWSMLAAFNSVTAVNGNLIGTYDLFSIFTLIPNLTSNRRRYMNSGIWSVNGVISNGVMGLAGNTAYLNGNSEGTIPTSADATRRIFICCGWSGNYPAGGPQYFCNGNVIAVAFWSSTLTAPQVAAVSAAMALL